MKYMTTATVNTSEEHQLRDLDLRELKGLITSMDVPTLLPGVTFEGENNIGYTVEDVDGREQICITYDIEIAGHQIPVLYTFWAGAHGSINYAIERLNGVTESGDVVTAKDEGTTNNVVFLGNPGSNGHISRMHQIMLGKLQPIVEYYAQQATPQLRKLILEKFDMLEVPE